jgi:glyoxylase-like metal-dependent hydrolase (beta-lactamase superfamily II)
MTDSTEQESQTLPPPVVADVEPDELAPSVHVLPDGRVPLVPNIGVVVGEREALVVDTGMGPKNGRRVLDKARALTDRPLVLTITHFHPEHGFGAQEFPDARIVYNRTQQEELAEKGSSYLEMFRTFGEAVAEQLEGVELVEPDEVYDDRTTLDLGGVDVELHHFGLAHTRGDQVVFLPGPRVLFTGDLVETRFFPIFPWFPPNDADVNGSGWIDVLTRLEALEPDVVVPGHGEVGGVELIGQVRSYLEDVRGRVGEAAGGGASSEEVKSTLEPEIRADYASWDAPEWIGFAVDCFYAELDA